METVLQNADKADMGGFKTSYEEWKLVTFMSVI